jgi:CheY-like chemotaxis protein
MAGNDIIEAVAKPAASILVVHGKVLVRIAISGYLRDCGYRVLPAADSDEALTVLEAPDHSVDVILSEVEIAGSMDGFALAQWVRSHKPGLPIMLVGSPSGAANAATELCNASPAVAETHHPETILKEIQRLLAEGSAAQSRSRDRWRSDDAEA